MECKIILYYITPVNNATVDELREVTVAFSRPGFVEPLQLYLNTAATAAKITEVYKEGSGNDPDDRPEIHSENIDGVSLALEDGLLKVLFAEPIREAGKIVVGIPSHAVINLNTRPNTPAQTLYEKGGCTNAPLQLTITVKPGTLTGIEAEVHAEPLDTQAIFTTDGKHVGQLQPGVNIVRSTTTTGKVVARKVIKR